MVLLIDGDFHVMQLRNVGIIMADHPSQCVNEEQLKNFKEDTKSLFKYQANKRCKFENEKKKKDFEENQKIFHANTSNH